MRKLLPLRSLIRSQRSSISSKPARQASSHGALFPSPAESYSSSRAFTDSLWSWRSGNVLPSGLFGLLSAPPLSKGAMAKTHFLVSLESLLERGIRSLKVSLRRRTSGFNGRQLFSSPWRSWRYSMLTPDGMAFGLIGANVAVFFLWKIADPVFMRKHFMISLDNFKSWRLHTLITSAFSHSDLDHLVTNMIGLYFFGRSIGRLFGPEFLLNLYLAGALGGSIFFLAHKAFIAPSSTGYQGWDYSRVPGLGASAAVNSIILLDVFLFPKNIYYVNLIIPVPAILMGAILIGTDLWRIKKGEEHISGSAHLGGAVVAALVWARIKGYV